MDEISELRAAVARLTADAEVRDLVLLQVVCKAAALDSSKGGYIDDIERRTATAIESLSHPDRIKAYMHHRSAWLHGTFRDTFALPVNLPKTGTANEP